LKNILLLLPILFSVFQSVPAPDAVPASPVLQTGTEPAAGSVVCVPGIYATPPDDCLPLGPSAHIARQIEAGIPYPQTALPAFTPPASLNQVPYQYFKVNDSGISLFNSLDAAISNQGPARSLAPGILYVSYTVRADTDQGIFYQLRSGLWIRADGARLGLSAFQGLQFSSQPEYSFGWVLGEIRSRTAPGFSAPETGRTWYRYNVVQVYAIQEAEGNTWLLIGPDEWLDYRHVARVDPKNSPPESIPSSRWIEVNLDEQTLAVYQDNRLVFATVVASGVEPFWTRPGIFQIYKKKDTETMSGATAADRSDYYYLEDVPWTMYYDEARAFHGAYWHNSFGYPRSHGCVNLSLGDSHWLFDWAAVGDYVYVYDPSGRTPTDPSLFGSGAP
jgi:hypothetical protein